MRMDRLRRMHSEKSAGPHERMTVHQDSTEIGGVRAHKTAEICSGLSVIPRGIAALHSAVGL